MAQIRYKFYYYYVLFLATLHSHEETTRTVEEQWKLQIQMKVMSKWTRQFKEVPKFLDVPVKEENHDKF